MSGERELGIGTSIPHATLVAGYTNVNQLASQPIRRQLLRIALLAPLLFLAWLLAVWPPPVWYRTHWPAETAFMRMRRQGGQAVRRQEETTRGTHAPLREQSACRLGALPPCRLYHPVPLDSIASVMGDAAMTGEDSRFREHSGLDYLAILHALGYRYRDFSWNASRDRGEMRRALGRAWERRDGLRGASTITQQLAKNLYLSPSRNPLRKLKEAVTAWRLEAALSKDRILELYLNVAEMGPEVWGVEAASQTYFRKPARRLTRSEAAALAGLLPFPLRSNPAYRPGRMAWRQNLILRRMGGEDVEVPKEAHDDRVVTPPTLDSLPADSVPVQVPLDSVPLIEPPVDTLVAPAPVESVPPPIDSSPIPSPP